MHIFCSNVYINLATLFIKYHPGSTFKMRLSEKAAKAYDKDVKRYWRILKHSLVLEPLTNAILITQVSISVHSNPVITNLDKPNSRL